MTIDRLLSSYDYELPPELIAQTPVVPRDTSRLLVVDSLNTRQHRIFRDLPDLLLPGDLLVLNNTRVIPARLYGRKSTGASVEILLLEERSSDTWLALVKPGKRFLIGTEIIFEPVDDLAKELGLTLKAKVIDKDEATGGRILQFYPNDNRSLMQMLDYFGQVPLPPYITSSESQPSQYQTVYARQLGSVAAPTAGLHFTEDLFQRLEEKGINKAFVTLHVGVGTFRPVEAEDITNHIMHQEWIEISQQTADTIEKTKAKGGRIIAVGTTVVRTLEGAANRSPESERNLLSPFCGKTDLFICPGYRWRVVDGLITNFHLPRSSLLMLVSALIGRERLLGLYREAIDRKYRFYSFGDAMLILPEAKLPDI